MRRLPFLLLLPALLAGRPQAPTLSEEIDKLVAGCGLKDPRIGIAVSSARSGRIVYRRADDRPYLLASNTKLFTCAAALDRLGPGHLFETEVHVRNLKDGVAGALVVTGTGDPHISGRDFDDNPAAVFEKWAAALRKKGVTRIDGPVQLVADKYDEKTTYPEWSSYPIDRWWAAPFAQFSLNDNCIDVLYGPGKRAGDPLELVIRPDTRFATVKNSTRTVKGRGQVAFQFIRKRGTNEILFKGDYALGNRPGKTWVALRDPQAFFATVLKETVVRAGIDVTGGIEILNREPEGLISVAKHTSRLDRVLQVCLKVSQNYYAEMLLLHLGWSVHGKGTRANGLKVVASFLRDAGVTGVDQKDGSGLTRENTASPRAILALLRHMDGHKHAKAFFDALAVNGAKVGTLRRRMTDKRYAGRVHAKTGHIAGVAALSGFVETEGDDTYIFSILVNVDRNQGTSRADRLQNRICELLARQK